MRYVRIEGKSLKISVCTESKRSKRLCLVAGVIERLTELLNPDAYKLVTCRIQVREYQNKSVCRADLETNLIRPVSTIE